MKYIQLNFVLSILSWIWFAACKHDSFAYPKTSFEKLCYCGPGYRVITHCDIAKRRSATCQLCPDDHYNDGWNNQTVCSECDNGDNCDAWNDHSQFEFVENCPYSDNVCQCKPGSYRRGTSSCDQVRGCKADEKLQNPDDRINPPICTKIETVTCPTNGDILSSTTVTINKANATGSTTVAYQNYTGNISAMGIKQEWKDCSITEVHLTLGVIFGFIVGIVASLSGVLIFLRRRKQKTHDVEEAQPLKPLKITNIENASNNHNVKKGPKDVFSISKMSSMEKLENMTCQMFHYTTAARANGAKPVKIAVVDSGANLKHPHVRGLRIIRTMNVIKDQDPNDMSDDCGHGTQVLSIIYQIFKMYDLLDCVEIVLIKAIDSVTTEFSYKDLINVVSHLQQSQFDDVKLVNISAGFLLRPEHEIKLARLVGDFVQKKILIGASSNIGDWNPDEIAYPAKKGISVGSLTAEGVRSTFSPRGKDLDFMAIGEGFSVANANFEQDGKEFVESLGTSLATPVVTCFAAQILIQLEYQMRGSGYDVERFRRILETTKGMSEVLKIMAQNTSHSIEMGYGALIPNRVFYNTDTYRSAITRALD